ncbi:MAG: peptide chain release factor N(5)-glutamine methyltransferase [Paracoccaceae bacterium]
MTTLSAALGRAIQDLRAAGVPDPATDARALMAHAAGLAPDRLTLHLQDTVDDAALDRFSDLIARRCAREPVSHLVGHRLFWGHRLIVTRDVLDPRPETEVLVAEALSQPFVKMLDLGTGSGCILVSCLAGMPMASGVGVDLSPAALAVATRNVDALGLTDRTRLMVSDWFSAVPGQFDLIVSNPPYIAADEMEHLSPEVREHEPQLALTPGGDGLDSYRHIARGAFAQLMNGGRLIVEIGPSQATAVRALFVAQGLQNIRCISDFDGRDRVIVAQKPADPHGCDSA